MTVAGPPHPAAGFPSHTIHVTQVSMFSRSLLTTAVAAVGVLASASPASAAAPTLGGLLSAPGRIVSGLLPKQDPACAAAPTTKPFARWGDSANYVPVPNGSFEDGLAGWKVKGNATVVEENEPWLVGGDSHAQAVSLPQGASITSGSFCGGLEYPTIRGFARSHGSHSILLLTVHYTGRDSLVHSLPLGILNHGKDWEPTGITLTGSGIPIFTGARLGLTATALKGGVTVDDLYVDPYRRS